MTHLPTSARVYVSTVVVLGLAMFFVYLPQVQFDQPLLLLGLLLLSSMSAALKVYLPLTTGGSTMSVSYAVDFASLLLLGPHETMFVAAGSAFSQCNLNKKERNPIYRTLFSVSSLVITVQGAGLAFRLLGGTGSTMPFTALARPLVGAATVYFLLNTGLIATAIALSARNNILTTWHNNFLWSAPSYFVGAGTAALAASLVGHAGYWVAPFTFAPLYLMYRTYKVYMGRIEDEQRHVQQTSDLHLATIEALARAIDAKDQTTQLHIRRVQVYAAGLAKAAGLSEHEIQGVKTAALLHDIGKLAVPEHILSKPGPLTQEEFQKIRIHPQVGAEIIAAVPFPYPVAPLILSHHERWDGKGYPQGLAGEDIPVGARILTIVDYYDAVTTERPYHKALNNDSALGLLRHEAGRALDPRLVPIFIEILPALVAEFGEEVPRGRRDAAGAVRHRFHVGRAGTGERSQRVREHRAGPPRDLRALRNRAVDGHQPRRVGHDGADLVEAVEDRAVVRLRALPPSAGSRLAEVPVRGGCGRAAAAQHIDEGGRGAVGLGRAQPAHADQRESAGQLRGGGPATAMSRCSRRWSARCSSTTRSSAAWRSTTWIATTTPRITAGCSSGSANRPAPSSTIRSSSSRRRKIR